MDRWKLYTLLQGKGDFRSMTETEIIAKIENVSVAEAREGIIEYLLALKRGGIFNGG